MQRKLLLLSLKRLALLPKSSKKAIICAFYDVFAKPRSVTYDKYAPSRELAKNLENPSNSRLFRREFFLGSPRDTVYPWGIWSPFYSALNIVFGAPAGYRVPVGLMVTFKRWDFFIFSKILAFSGRLFLCFFEYRNIMCAD